MKQSTKIVVALASLSMLEVSNGFSSVPIHSRHQVSHQVSSATALHLLPNQGNQLIAAFNAAYFKKEQVQQEEDVINKQEIENAVSNLEAPKTSAARAFVSRVFSLPSTMIRRHPHPKAEGFQNMLKKTAPTISLATSGSKASEKKKVEDVVYYPVVGFQFVKASPERTVALPTTSNAACRLRRNQNEDVYGWFTPACKLDMFSEDLCHEPLN